MTAPRVDHDRRPRDADDLRRACIHEFAHLAVARHFGACGFVTIVPVAGNAGCYAGRFQMHGELSEQQWRIVALAGTIAELIDTSPPIDPLAIFAHLRGGGLPLSTLDAQLAAEYDASDVAQCVDILRGAWTTVVADAAERCGCATSDAGAI